MNRQRKFVGNAINCTNHDVVYYSKANLIKYRRGEFLLPEPSAFGQTAKPNFVIPHKIAKSANYNPEQQCRANLDGVMFRGARSYATTIELFDEICPQDITPFNTLIVSDYYKDAVNAAVLRGIYVPYYDRMYVPGGKVVTKVIDEDSKKGKMRYEVIGCTAFDKVAPYYYPSYYVKNNLRFCADIWTLQQVVYYWMQILNSQTPNGNLNAEVAYLNEIRQYLYSMGIPT